MPGKIDELLVDFEQLEEISAEMPFKGQNLKENTLWYAPFAYESGKYTSLSVCSNIGDVFADYMKGLNGISEAIAYENDLLISVVEELKNFDNSVVIDN